ncbi:hypothetical protein GCM10011452_07380 [Gemmobacter lanyuensis]|uniref:Uncharacterized protein n=1 Tax=Gemmobacter lanyuensis TaxID=1054497 RepID=A0A918IMK1_9RHOB|nr:hypothetical protein [Gemmobacter lanyuensis]GGW23047.1 hypothetical protein GCM10011452_07380 [Gemmobacter lanyuensis]
MRLLPACLIVTAFLGAAAPARADLVLTGVDAQRLHCAAMLMVISDRLAQAGFIPAEARAQAQVVAVALLSELPGSERDRVRALVQRADKLMRTRTMPALLDEFEATVDWCAAQVPE